MHLAPSSDSQENLNSRSEKLLGARIEGWIYLSWMGAIIFLRSCKTWNNKRLLLYLVRWSHVNANANSTPGPLNHYVIHSVAKDSVWLDWPGFHSPVCEYVFVQGSGDGTADQLVHRFSPNWSINNFRWIAVKFRTVIHGPHRMYPDDFGDSLTFVLAPLWHLWFWVKCLNNYVNYVISLVICWLFDELPSSGQKFNVSNYINAKYRKTNTILISCA